MYEFIYGCIVYNSKRLEISQCLERDKINSSPLLQDTHTDTHTHTQTHTHTHTHTHNTLHVSFTASP